MQSSYEILLRAAGKNLTSVRAHLAVYLGVHDCEQSGRTLSVSNGFAESGGGGASMSLPASTRAVAGQDDDDGGDPDPEPERRRSPDHNLSPLLLLPLRAVSGRCFLSHSHIYSLIREGLFPAPVKIGRTSRWVASEIDTWIASCIQQRSASSAR